MIFENSLFWVANIIYNCQDYYLQFNNFKLESLDIYIYAASVTSLDTPSSPVHFQLFTHF